MNSILVCAVCLCVWPVARVSRTETDTSAERTIIILVAGSVAAAKLIIVLSIVSCPRSILLPLFFADFDVFFFSFPFGVGVALFHRRTRTVSICPLPFAVFWPFGCLRIGKSAPFKFEMRRMASKIHKKINT